MVRWPLVTVFFVTFITLFLVVHHFIGWWSLFTVAFIFVAALVVTVYQPWVKPGDEQ